MKKVFLKIKNFLKKLSGDEWALARRISYVGTAVVGALMSLLLYFTDFLTYSYYDKNSVLKTCQMSPANTLQVLSETREAPLGIAWIEIITLALFALVAVILTIILISSIISLVTKNERKLEKKVKSILVISTIATGLYTIVPFILVPIINSMKGNVAMVSNAACFIVMIVLDCVYALYRGLLYCGGVGRADLSKNERKKYRYLGGFRLELFLYAVIITGLTVAAILSNIMTVTFSSESTIETININGLNLFKGYKEEKQGARVIVYILFVMLVVLSSVFFLSFTSFLGRSNLFYKLTLSSVLVGALLCLLVGLFGKYYEITQALNEDMILKLLTQYNIPIEKFSTLDYEVKSSSLYFFIGIVAVLAVVLIRRPYSKGVAVEAKLNKDGFEMIKTEVSIEEISKDAASQLGGAGEMGMSTAMPVQEEFEDPCPAFTELDERSAELKAKLKEKKKAAFEEPTLSSIVQFVVEYARDSRLHLSYTEEDIATFIAGLGITKLSILQGMSGTGKTSLPKIFSEALFSNCDIVEVESSWRDKNELLGYYNEFSKIYTPKKFTQALYAAALNPEVLTFIVLDEMNLSRVEYYFSDFLSLMENEAEKRELKLLNVKLYKEENGKKVNYQGLTNGHTLKIPANVWFVGTANRDESTFEISDKVYDRAHTMNFNKRAAKVVHYKEPKKQRYVSVSTLEALFKKAKEETAFSIEEYAPILEVEKILEPYNISFGNRVALQIEEFVAIYCACFTKTDEVIHNAVEKIMLSKVVSKLELKSVENKADLAMQFEKLGFHRCAAFIRKLNED